MIMTPPDALVEKITGELYHHDWMRKFNDCYIRVDVGGGVVPVRTTNLGIDVDSSDEEQDLGDRDLILEVRTRDGETHRLVYDENLIIDYTPPNFGMVVHNKELVYVDRIIDRQWSESLCSNWCSFFMFDSKKYGGSDILFSMFDTVYVPIQQAVDSIRKGDAPAHAIHEHWGVFVNKDYRDIMVAYKSHIVGHVDDMNRVILYPYAVHTREYLSEIVDCQVIIEEVPIQCQSK